MPQTSQILGVNSVTNIELYKGFLPAPIIRNADWFEKFDRAVSLSAFSNPRKASDGQQKRTRSLFLAFYRIVANGRFTRGGRIEGVNSGWMAGPCAGSAMPGLT
jgi:hypothetical protein